MDYPDYGFNFVIVIPTFNEQDSIEAVLSGLEKTLEDCGYHWAVLVINDGTDNTEDIVHRLMWSGKRWLHIINRDQTFPNPGLSGAMMLGLNTAIGTMGSQYVIFMDGDGQHPAEAVLRMADMAFDGKYGIIVSTRYQSEGSAIGLGSPQRRLYSKVFGLLPRLLFPGRLWQISDPLTGFFMVHRRVIPGNQLWVKTYGWKFGLEVFLAAENPKIGQLPYEFEERLGGESKANARVAFQYLRHLASLFWRYYFG